MSGYFRTIRNYLTTDKAKFDFKEYTKAGLLFLATCFICMALV